MLLKKGLLQCEVGLGVKDMAAATMGWSIRTLGPSTLDRKAPLGPKAALTDDLFHAFESPRIIGMIIWKIERLLLSCQGIYAITHAWPLQVVHSEMLGILWDINNKVAKKERNTHS